jgi:hypothetical protein
MEEDTTKTPPPPLATLTGQNEVVNIAVSSSKGALVAELDTRRTAKARWGTVLHWSRGVSN